MAQNPPSYLACLHSTVQCRVGSQGSWLLQGSTITPGRHLGIFPSPSPNTLCVCSCLLYRATRLFPAWVNSHRLAESECDERLIRWEVLEGQGGSKAERRARVCRVWSGAMDSTLMSAHPPPTSTPAHVMSCLVVSIHQQKFGNANHQVQYSTLIRQLKQLDGWMVFHQQLHPSQPK